MDSNRRNCAAITKRNRQCSRRAMPESNYCRQHHSIYKASLKSVPKRSKIWNKLNQIGIGKITLIGIVSAIAVVIGFAGDTLGLYDRFKSNQAGKMSGDFRIAIAEFTVEDSIVPKSFGMDLAEGMYQRLQQETDKFTTVSVTIWGPKQVRKAGEITGTTLTEKAISVEQIAQDIGANILVYGDIEAVSSRWIVQPRFYISEEGFYEAQEIIGQHNVGKPIELLGQDNTASRFEFSDELTRRIQLLSQLTIGIIYFSIQEYEQSLRVLLQAEEIDGLNKNDGLQVLHLLIGNAAGKRNEIAGGESRYLDVAETNYQKALRLDSEYSRAYIGLASVQYNRALYSEKPNAELLNKAIELYLKALDAKNQPDLADISTKAHFGLGQSLMVLALIGEDATFLSSISEFERVINDYNEGDNPRVRVLAGEAHARLGRIYLEIDMQMDALAEYEAATDLLIDYPQRQELYEQRVIELQGKGS